MGGVINRSKRASTAPASMSRNSIPRSEDGSGTTTTTTAAASSSSKNEKKEGYAQDIFSDPSTELKMKLLMDMFPELEIETLSSVLEANCGDVDRTVEMFLPMSPVKVQETNQKRPPTRSGLDDMSCDDIKELIKWASSSDARLQFQGVRSLADLAISAPNQTAIMHAGGLAPIIKLTASPNTDVHRAAAIAIANLALNDDIQALLHELGAIERLIKLGENDDISVSVHAARALANIAYCNQRNEEAIVKLGGLSTLIKLLGVNNEEVEIEAIAALANVARNENTQKQIVEAGALPALVGLLKSPNVELQRQSCRLLSNIFLDETNRKLVASGAVEGCSSLLGSLVLLARIGASDVQRLAVMTLANWTLDENLQVRLVEEAGGLDVVFSLITGSQQQTQLHAARILANVSQNASNRQKIVKNHGLKQFFSMAQSQSEELQLLASQCLSNLSSVQGVSSSWG